MSESRTDSGRDSDKDDRQALRRLRRLIRLLALYAGLATVLLLVRALLAK